MPDGIKKFGEQLKKISYMPGRNLLAGTRMLVHLNLKDAERCAKCCGWESRDVFREYSKTNMLGEPIDYTGREKGYWDAAWFCGDEEVYHGNLPDGPHFWLLQLLEVLWEHYPNAEIYKFREQYGIVKDCSCRHEEYQYCGEFDSLHEALCSAIEAAREERE